MKAASGELLVTLADKNYIPQVKQLFSSVYYNSGWKGDYMLLANGFGPGESRWFHERGILVEEVEVGDAQDFEGLPATVLAKFRVFTKGFRRWKSVVFLDGDISVEASLDGLTGLKGFWAAPDFHARPLGKQFKTPGRETTPEERKAYGRLKARFDLKEVSFNTGVFAFDTSIIRASTYDTVMGLYKEYGSISLFEQSILNLYFYRGWRPLSLVYNNYHLYRRIPWSVRFKKCPGIVDHFVLDKPWKTKNPDYYPAWKRNLDRADGIDLSKRPAPRSVWGEEKNARVASLLGQTPRRNYWAHRWSDELSRIDNTLARAGKRLRSRHPGLYNLVKRGQ